MKKLGELLTERGWISRSDLMRALHHQRLVGGRLGTCLLEMGVVSEEHLIQALADQHRVEGVDVDALRNVPEDLREALPGKIAVRCRAVPVHATTSKLTVAMVDPGDLGCQDELSFASSRRLTVAVASEVRIREALDRYYGEPVDARFSRILDHLNRRRYLWRDDEEGGGKQQPDLEPGERSDSGRPLFPDAPDRTPPPLPRPDFDKPEPDQASGAAPAAAGTATSATTATDTDTEAPEAPAGGRRTRPTAVRLSREERNALYGGRAPAPLSYEEAEDRLGEMESRDLAGELVVDFLRQEFDRVLLFAVRKDAVTGWMGDAEGLDDEALERLRIPLSQPSLFLNLRHGGAFHLGPLPAMPAHRPLVELLGGEAPEEVLLLPVRIADRMVAILWCDRGGEHLGSIDLEALRALADTLADTLERCILLKRQAQT